LRKNTIEEGRKTRRGDYGRFWRIVSKPQTLL
jgi:hypothetical protein